MTAFFESLNIVEYAIIYVSISKCKNIDLGIKITPKIDKTFEE